jgi:hypothetical protein
VATSDAKYAERCRLENYAFLGEALRGLAQKLPALQQHWQVCVSSALDDFVVSCAGLCWHFGRVQWGPWGEVVGGFI